MMSKDGRSLDLSSYQGDYGPTVILLYEEEIVCTQSSDPYLVLRPPALLNQADQLVTAHARYRVSNNHQIVKY